MEKINIAQLLKYCPQGMELDCTMFENLEFDRIEENAGTCLIICRAKTGLGGYNVHTFTEYGCYSKEKYAKCVIYPKGKTTWEGFHRPFKDGDIVAYDNPHRDNLQVFIFKSKKENNTLSSCYLMLDGDELDLEEGMYYVTRLATEEEKQKLFQAIRDNGYKWNDETKTLEKMFKDKFDITTLKAFESRVLVRDYDNQIWIPTFWGKYLEDDSNCRYLTTNGCYKYCIPYEGNEHLLGTTNDCDDYYKYWE